ncbi:MAG TPA: chitobiase/beta-hexosaminidase C-terminal domain-containing protein [Nocardioidaceae bacterium]|nr:chitobiase/beta-hexosaminidase C-terminal domain-containing protein [Nocardioidaceae bacterium]
MNRSFDAPASARARNHPHRAPGGRLIKASALGALSCAVATAGLVVPADAAVNAAHTVFVLKDDSIVEAEGYRPGESVLIQVKRDGVLVGSARASSPGGALAINHDSCWTDFTPVILAGDVVEVISSTGRETVPVADIELTEGATLVGTNSFTIKGRVNSTPLPPASELVAFARTEDPVRFRPTTPDDGSVAYDATGDGAFTATFTMNAQQQTAFPNLGEVSVAHAPAANEQTIATGANPVPGPGCGVDAPLVTSAVTAVTPGAIRLRNRNATVRVQGFAPAGAGVEVRLSDADGTVVTATAAPTSAGAQTWTAALDAGATADLSGAITVSALVDGTRSSVEQTVRKDLVGPEAPTASLGAGDYRRAQFVALSAGTGDQIRYTVGNGRQAAPTATRGRLYRGGQIRIASSQVLKMIAIDEVGNLSRVARVRYVILRRAGKPALRRALSGAAGGRATAVARWRAPAGSQVTGYRVKALQLRRNGTVASRTQSALLRPGRRALAMRLTSGRYRFQVRAVNALGNGRWSARSNVVRAR